MESAANGSARVKRSSKTTGKPEQKVTQQSIDSVNQELLLCGSSYYVPGFVKEVDKTEQSCPPYIIVLGKDCGVPQNQLSLDLILGAS